MNNIEQFHNQSESQNDQYIPDNTQVGSAAKSNQRKTPIVIAILLGLAIVLSLLLMKKQENSQAPEFIQSQEQVQTLNDSNEINMPAVEDEPAVQALPPIEDKLAVRDKADLSLVSVKESYQVGEQIQVTLQLESGVTPDGVQYVIKFNPMQITEVRVEPANSFGSFVTNRVDLQTNEIKGMLLREPQEEVNLAVPQGIVTIYGVTTQAGNLRFEFDLERTEIAAAGGQDVKGDVRDLSLLVY